MVRFPTDAWVAQQLRETMLSAFSSCAPSGQVVTATFSNIGDIGAVNNAFQVVIDDLVNPGGSGVTSDFYYALTNNSDAVIEYGWGPDITIMP